MARPTPPSPCLMKVRIIWSSVSAVVGLSILLCFGIVYDNWHCAVWGLVSGIFAAVCTLVHYFYMRDEFLHASRHLRFLMLLGCFGQLVGLCGFIAYLASAILLHQDLTPYGKGYYVTAVWCFMTWKWGFMLFYFAHGYKKLFEATFKMSADTKYERI